MTSFPSDPPPSDALAAHPSASADSTSPRGVQRPIPCPLERWSEGLQILFRRAPQSLRPAMIAEALKDLHTGQLAPDTLWITLRHDRTIGAIRWFPLDHHTAFLHPPEVVHARRRAAVAAQLVRAVLKDLKHRGLRAVQALLDPEQDQVAAADFIRGGLPAVTTLELLERSTLIPPIVPQRTPRLVWREYQPDLDQVFDRILRRTAIDSLDLPELNGLRGFQDVLAGQVAAGRFLASFWRLGAPIEEGPNFDPWARPERVVLLCAPSNRYDAWELTYLGLTPEARGRGLARRALADALELTREHASRLTLAVDLRNLPAVRLYRAAGFVPFDRRAVHLLRLN
ncbi:GCN5-related N-acetyltransferase [Isosphaera pallida ATCC 43644]|uniref:GCN5-related N-acetyltransferase n=1 Tax=Isosphaera pallida (strain ATCC 43644 / DSM 9630 / IS1B) TaxID=575540 RepID=E8QXD5_ISOPI|nr:GNAT family N-acetyltransferase [Isosphaera pallida]ADV61976.1 GCN5-related N-acetyltransferase [Isosphaera pallida ATCC 43644]